MKTTKLNLANIREKLSKEQMKQILAGTDPTKKCQDDGDDCDPPNNLNCCSHLICSNNGTSITCGKLTE